MGSRVRQEEEEIVSKSNGSRIMEESLELDFSSSIRGRDFLCAFPMPPIPIDLRYSFRFLLAYPNILSGEGGKYKMLLLWQIR